MRNIRRNLLTRGRAWVADGAGIFKFRQKFRSKSDFFLSKMKILGEKLQFENYFFVKEIFVKEFFGKEICVKEKVT